MSDSKTEQTLLEAARAGDRAALEELLTLEQSRIYRYGMKMCGDPEDAQEVLQETMIALAQSIENFRGEAALSTWLYTVARSFCLKRRRKSRFAPKEVKSLEAGGQEVAELREGGSAPDDALSNKELECVLDTAIRSLDAEQRDVLVLRDVEGLTAPEVSDVLGISVAAVKSRLHRARLAVRDKVRPFLEDVDDPGPSCPDVLSMFSKSLEDEISADLCERMEQHVAQCPKCQHACDSLKQTLALCKQRGADRRVPATVQRSVREALRDFLGQESSP